MYLRKLSDTFHKNLLARLSNISNLVDVNARYHSSCMSKFYVNRLSGEIGRPPSKSVVDFIQYIIDYIENNSSESQFSLNVI